jgi:thiol-disulfide isomerase/thioredoxin
MSARLGYVMVVVSCIGIFSPDRLAHAAANPLDFRLTDPRDDRIVSFDDLRNCKAIVVVFLGTECVVSNAFLPVLEQLHKEYASKGVAFLGVNSNQQDTPARIAAHSREHAIPFPVVKDVANRLADRLEARRTPEALVIDGTAKVLYRGRIDDQFGVGFSRPNKPTRRDLALALDEVLAGKPVSVPMTGTSGCLISRVVEPKKDGKVTFARQVSRILQKNCQECHRPGHIGPMALLSYDNAVAWADTIQEVVTEGRMPPWHADPRYGEFSNDRSMSEAERKTLLEWLEGGMPRGDARDLPPARTFPEGWRIGTPDAIFKLPRSYEVPAKAQGGVPYKFFAVDAGFTEDRWVQRAEARPGAPAVVHHIVVFIQPKGELFNPDGPGNLLCGTAPGDMPLMLPDGFAKKVPAGAKLIFQMHYTPNGKAYTDRSEVGIIFARKPPAHRVLTKPIHNATFLTRFDKIPAGAEDYRIDADHSFGEDCHLLAFMPHMHLRGKDFKYDAIFPNGKRQTLLFVPHYQFGWQSVYRCARPIAVPKGAKVECVAHFDNSAKNPNNPDPTRDVYWGDQTWEEMMLGWIEYYRDEEKP